MFQYNADLDDSNPIFIYLPIFIYSKYSILQYSIYSVNYNKTIKQYNSFYYQSD